MMETWHDALQIREEALDRYSWVFLTLLQGPGGTSVLVYNKRINLITTELKHVPDEFRNLSKLLADKYFCNFSLFQSLPDSWAIDQIFPIMPIHRLEESRQGMQHYRISPVTRR